MSRQDFHIPNGPTPYPAHESLQQYARRMRLPVQTAYKRWHARGYAAAVIQHGNPELPSVEVMSLREHGPGLGLLDTEVRCLARQEGAK